MEQEGQDGTLPGIHGRVAGRGSMGPIAGAGASTCGRAATTGAPTVQDPEHRPEFHLRGRFSTRRGRQATAFLTHAAPPPVSDTRTTGRSATCLFVDQAAHPWRPARVHMIVSAPGLQSPSPSTSSTPTSAYLDSDAVFAVKPSLIRTFTGRSADDVAPAARRCQRRLVLGRERHRPRTGERRRVTSEAFLVGGVRTPFGRYRGALAEARPDDLAAEALKGALGADGRCPGRPGRDSSCSEQAANQAGEDNRNVARMARCSPACRGRRPATRSTGFAPAGCRRWSPRRSRYAPARGTWWSPAVNR